ncbi:MAG: UrcA family protein [Novosphingobium sp.]|nr:UrcA family protein [Novosphingobium sp.]
MTITKTLLAATVLVLTPAIAYAQSGGYERASVEVRTDDINLSSPAGQDILDRRIATAVRKVCGYSTGNVWLSARSKQRDCMSKARSQALASARRAQESTLAAK